MLDCSDGEYPDRLFEGRWAAMYLKDRHASVWLHSWWHLHESIQSVNRSYSLLREIKFVSQLGRVVIRLACGRAIEIGNNKLLYLRGRCILIDAGGRVSKTVADLHFVRRSYLQTNRLADR